MLNRNFNEKIQNGSIINYENNQNFYDQYINWEEQSQINN